MNKFSSFPKIEQFRTIVKNVQSASAFVGLDEDNNAIFDNTRPKPIIQFTGTVKLHGTNAGVGFDGKEVWAQKRGGICTVEKDNAGFAFFVESRKGIFRDIGLHLQYITNADQVYIFGEWCGGNIQKGVGISGLDKMFVIFDIKCVTGDQTRWMDRESISKFSCEELGIYNIYDFDSWQVDVDFARPEEAQREFIKITEAVEAECPVAKFFGVEKKEYIDFPVTIINGVIQGENTIPLVISRELVNLSDGKYTITCSA